MLKRLISILTAMAGLMYYYARYVEPERIEVTEYRVTLPHLAREFHGYRIVQMSDLHLDRWMTAERLARVLTLTQRQQGDLIVITGDFVSRRNLYEDGEFTRLFSQLSAPDGVLAIPGNHDYFSPHSIDRLRKSLKSVGITDLSNKVHSLQRGDARLHIAGVDDVVARKARLDLVLDQLPDDGQCAILLAHEPDFADIVAPYQRFDLQLSGHTHGGQVRLPFYGALISPKHGQRYDSGWFFVDKMRLYVNRGVGMVTLTLRFNCRPEITVLTLNAPTSFPV